MEMLLTLLCMTFLGVAVSVLLFGAATREPLQEPEVRTDPSLALMAPGFFVHDDARTAATAAGPRVPLEVLLLQIERHVRLEQAAAESFLDRPTAESLHRRTTSPLGH